MTLFNSLLKSLFLNNLTENATNWTGTNSHTLSEFIRHRIRYGLRNWNVIQLILLKYQKTDQNINSLNQLKIRFELATPRLKISVKW